MIGLLQRVRHRHINIVNKEIAPKEYALVPLQLYETTDSQATQ